MGVREQFPDVALGRRSGGDDRDPALPAVDGVGHEAVRGVERELGPAVAQVGRREPEEPDEPLPPRGEVEPEDPGRSSRDSVSKPG